MEDRCVPTVTTAFEARTGALTVTGDAADNQITITENGAINGSYRVAAVDGISGGTAFTGVRGIAVVTQGQKSAAGDTLDLVGDGSANSSLIGLLSVASTGGLKVGFQSNFNVRGPVSITKTTNVGGLTVQTGGTAGGAAQANVSLGATTITNSGAGSTTFVMAGANPNALGFSGSLSITTGSGTSDFALVSATIRGNLTQSAAGSAKVFLSSTTVGGFVSLNGTAADSGLRANFLSVTIGVFFSVASGNGADTVIVNDTSVLGLGLTPPQQTFGVNLKGGTNITDIGGNGAAAANVVHGSLFHFGAGTETFNLKNYTITSFVTINAQAGNAGITAHISNLTISTFLSFAAAGAANDDVSVDNLTIGQNFALDLGGGTNTSTITNNHYLGSYTEADGGSDVITFTGNTGLGDVTLSAVSLVIDVGKFVNDQIAGNATFTSGDIARSNLVNLGAALGASPTADTVLSVGKALTIRVGPGFNTVTLDNVLVKGDLTVTAAGFVGTTITNTAVGGNLAVNADDSVEAVTVNLGTTAADHTRAVVILGAVTVSTGSGNDTVNLTDVTAVGATTLTTNGGLDTIRLEGTAGNTGPSQFFGAVTVSTGDAADTITVGLNADNQAQFYAAVTFDGGTGTDTLIETAPQYLGGPPTKVSIP
jgi:hypothetical protein